MKPVSHFSVANIRISEQTTKFYLSFFTLFLPNATNTSPTPLSSRATPRDLIIHQTLHIFSVNPAGINIKAGRINSIIKEIVQILYMSTDR